MLKNKPQINNPKFLPQASRKMSKLNPKKAEEKKQR
jgi:hypothetical protein